MFRSSRPEVFSKKDVLRNFTKFTGKHLCQSLFFKEVAGLRPATLLKKRPWHRCFPVKFVKFLRTPFFTKHLRATASDCSTHIIFIINLRWLLVCYLLFQISFKFSLIKLRYPDFLRYPYHRVVACQMRFYEII